MTPERWQQISRIFKSAISLNSEDRAAYLKAQCLDDDSLRVDVEKLLASRYELPRPPSGFTYDGDGHCDSSGAVNGSAGWPASALAMNFCHMIAG